MVGGVLSNEWWRNGAKKSWSGNSRDNGNGTGYENSGNSAGGSLGDYAAALAKNARPNVVHDWSHQQLDIFDWFENGSGNLVVVARAGCSKTVSSIEGVKRAPEKKILMTAFGKRIADELKKRVPSHVDARTFHSLGLDICRRRVKKLEIDDWANRNRVTAAIEAWTQVAYRDSLEFSRLSAWLRHKNTVKEIGKLVALFKSMSPSGKSKEILALIQEKKMVSFDWPDFLEDGPSGDNKLNTVEAVRDLIVAIAAKAVKFVVDEAIVGNELTVSYDDMVFLPVRMRWAWPRYELLVVDEAQDLSEAQVQLAKGSVLKDGRIAVVGDNYQALYGWRGADFECLDRMTDELDAKVLPLTISYRCPVNVVKTVAKYVPDFTANKGAIQGTVTHLEIGYLAKHAPAGSFVLSRSNAPLMSVCLSLLAIGKPAVIAGKDVGAQLVAILKKVEGKIPFSHMKDLEMRLLDWAKKERIKNRAHCKNEEDEERMNEVIDDKMCIFRALVKKCSNPEQIKKRLEDLFSDDLEEKDVVICSTIHQSKGLERDNVYILADSFFKDEKTEDYVKYVACTRSKKNLCFVTYPEDDRENEFGGGFGDEKKKRYKWRDWVPHLTKKSNVVMPLDNINYMDPILEDIFHGHADRVALKHHGEIPDPNEPFIDEEILK